MKKFAFVAALSACAVTLISLAPAQARPDESKRIAPTATLKMGAAVERTPEQMSAFDATFASPGQVREVAVRPTMDAAQYAQLKQAAALAPHASSRPGAFAPDSPLAVVNTKFVGASECDDPYGGCWIPPDVAGSIGKSQFVSVSNDVFQVRSRGGVLLKHETLNALFGYGLTPMFDPRVQWDEEYQRWIVTADSFAVDSTHQYFGIAISKTNSATGAWWIYFLNVTGFAGTSSFYDFPMLGMTQDAVLLTANIFAPSGSFAGSSIFSVAKARLYNGFGFSVPVITGLTGTMQTAHQNLTDQNGYAWYAAAPSNSGAIYMVAESYPANPNLTGFFGYYGVSGVAAYSVPPPAPQPSGCSNTLDTLDNRFQNAGTQNGDVYYQVHTVANGGFSEPRYYVITGLLTFAPTVSAVADVYANGSSWDFNPSIASDPAGHFGLNWSTTTPAFGFPSGNAGEHFRDNNPSNPTGSGGLYVFTSASCYNTSGGGTYRWGDYSQVSVDPGPGTVANTNTKIFWIDNETVPSVNFWSTEIAKITW